MNVTIWYCGGPLVEGADVLVDTACGRTSGRVDTACGRTSGRVDTACGRTSGRAGTTRGRTSGRGGGGPLLDDVWVVLPEFTFRWVISGRVEGGEVDRGSFRVQGRV